MLVLNNWLKIKDLLACLVSAAINIPVLNDKDEVENDVAQLQKKIVIKMWMNEKISDKDRDYFYSSRTSRSRYIK